MDPHPDLPYLSHVLDMARTSMAKVPSSGVCIDRQDWIGVTNPNADDGRTWLPVGAGFLPVRAMIHSWKPAMEAFAEVWHEGGQAVIINDHSNRLDMMEFVDGIYAEMGDMSAAAAGSSSSGSLNSHGIGTALASLGPTVAYIWSHPKKPSQMTAQYVSDGLQTHLWAGVFPTVPVKNNDHAIGGDCAPSCAYDGTFSSYGHLFNAIRGRSWVLAAHAAVVASKNALANLFSIPVPGHRSTGSSPRLFAAVVILAPASADVTLSLKGLGSNSTNTGSDGRACTPTIDTVLSPTNQKAATAIVTSATAHAAELKLSFTGSNVSHGAAVVMVAGC
jgi:hypothetical protein